MRAELENYLNRIENLRSQIGKLIIDLPPEALNWRPIERSEAHEVNSLGVMVTHVAGAEHFWIAEVIGQRPQTRDRAAEFSTEVADAVTLLGLLEKVGAETEEVLASLQDSDLGQMRQRDQNDISIRWAILHVVDHAALHLGHMQITYQLWQGGQAFQAPRWFERLPG